MTQPHRAEGDAALELYFAAARAEPDAPLPGSLQRRLTDQALAAMPAKTAQAPETSRRARRSRRPGASGWRWIDRLVGPPGLAGVAAAAGLAGLAIGLWVPGLGEVTDGTLATLGWTGLPLAEPDLPWGEENGLLALIDG